MSKFNVNDPKLWQSWEPEDSSEEYIDQASEFQIQQRRRGRLAAENPEWKDRHQAGIDKFVNSPEHRAKDQRAAETRRNMPELWAKSKESTARARQTPEFQKNWRLGMDQRKNNEEYKQNLSKGHKKRIQTPYGEFPSLNEAAEYMTSLGITNTKIKIYQNLKKDPKNWYYIDKPMKVQKSGRAKPCHTPLGDYANTKLAADALGIHDQTLRDRIKDPRKPEYYYIT